MTESQGILKLYRQDNQPFTVIPNELVRDPEITPNAFRLIAYLMSHKDGYDLTYTQIERQTGLGRFAINNAIDNLVRKGWLLVDRPKGADGRYASKSWTVLNPTTVGDSTVGNSTMEQPTDIKKNTNKEEQVKEITTRPHRIPKDFRVTDEMAEWAKTNHPEVDVSKATLNFVDYWETKTSNATKLDWVRTWQMWIRNTKPDTGRRKPKNDWDALDKWAKEEDERRGL